MNLNEIRAELTHLHSASSELLADVLHVRPSIRLVLRRRPLDDLEERLDGQLKAFVALDAELIQHTNPPLDYNAATRGAAISASTWRCVTPSEGC